jgi:hypothetical protein
MTISINNRSYNLSPSVLTRYAAFVIALQFLAQSFALLISK